MTFAHPLVLLLLAVPALLLWAVPQRGPGVAMPFDHQPHRRRRGMSLLLGAFECVPALLLAAMIAILAGPQVLRTPPNARELTNIQFLMDVSGSMSWEDRYKNAKEAIERFTAAREGDAFGLTLFGSHQIRWCPLTTDLSAVRNALPFANPERQPPHMGGTMIGNGLLFCRDNMMSEAQQGDRMIILVSDGQSSDLADGRNEEIAMELEDAGIVVFYVHASAEEMPPETVEIAQKTGGEAFQASDPASFARVFATIDRMKPAQFRAVGTVPMEHARPFAIAALGLLSLTIVGLLFVRYTPW